MINFIIAITLSAHAGKLAEGFRGLSFGPADVLSEAPMDGCLANTEVGVRWSCPTTIGGVPVTANYMVQTDVFVSVLINVEGYANATKYRAVLEAAYGPGRPQKPYAKGGMDDWAWQDGSVYATFSYNRFTDRVTSIIFDMTKADEAKARAAKAAAEATGDL